MHCTRIAVGGDIRRTTKTKNEADHLEVKKRGRVQSNERSRAVDRQQISVAWRSLTAHAAPLVQKLQKGQNCKTKIVSGLQQVHEAAISHHAQESEGQNEIVSAGQAGEGLEAMITVQCDGSQSGNRDEEGPKARRPSRRGVQQVAHTNKCVHGPRGSTVRATYRSANRLLTGFGRERGAIELNQSFRCIFHRLLLGVTLVTRNYKTDRRLGGTE